MTKVAKLPALSILSLSLLTMATGATAGTISEIGREFTQASQATVELTVTMPSMTMAIFIIISNFLIKKTGTKKSDNRRPHAGLVIYNFIVSFAKYWHVAGCQGASRRWDWPI